MNIVNIQETINKLSKCQKKNTQVMAEVGESKQTLKIRAKIISRIH